MERGGADVDEHLALLGRRVRELLVPRRLVVLVQDRGVHRGPIYPFSESSCGLLAQHELLDLPGAGLGQLVDHHDPLRDLELGEALARELLDRLDVGLAPAGGGDERHGHLAPALVRRGDDGDLGDRVVRGDRLLDLDRGDVLAARDDHVLEAVAQLDVAVLVHDAEVAGVEPAALERLARRLLVVEVAHHHVVAAHDDLAERLAVGGHVLHVLVDHAQALRHDRADALARAQLRLLLVVAVVPVRVPRAHGERAVDLGQPVEVGDVEVELGALLEQRRATAARRPRTPRPARRAARPRRRRRSW